MNCLHKYIKGSSNDDFNSYFNDDCSSSTHILHINISEYIIVLIFFFFIPLTHIVLYPIVMKLPKKYVVVFSDNNKNPIVWGEHNF